MQTRLEILNMKRLKDILAEFHMEFPTSAAVLCVAFGIASISAMAQKPPAPAVPADAPARTLPGPQATLTSPEVHPDGVVVFRLYAPSAQDVRVQAEGMEATPGITAEEAAKMGKGYPMTLGDSGVWFINFGPVQPGVYRYVFLVDGVRVDDPRNPVVSQSLNSAWSMYEVPGASFLEYKRDVPHGDIASVWYDSSPAAGLRRMHVYTPPGYENGNAKYPVLYLLHGALDTDDSWGTVGRAGAILDNLIAVHKAQPMIIVMPAGHMTRDFLRGAAAGASIGHDGFIPDVIGSIMPYVESHYRTLNDRDHRAIAGLSMGGMQTLNISLLHSDLFAYAGVFSSGWLVQDRGAFATDLLARYKVSGKPFKVYWMAVGRLDGVKDSAHMAAERLKNDGIPVVFHDSEGFHAWNNWRDYLATFAQMLFTAPGPHSHK
jgi:enterochelin esterase family protein